LRIAVKGLSIRGRIAPRERRQARGSRDSYWTGAQGCALRGAPAFGSVAGRGGVGVQALRHAAAAGFLLLPDELLEPLARLEGCVLRYRPSAPAPELEAAIEAALSESGASSELRARLRPPSGPPATL
jgi:hypothetical protein